MDLESFNERKERLVSSISQPPEAISVDHLTEEFEKFIKHLSELQQSRPNIISRFETQPQAQSKTQSKPSITGNDPLRILPRELWESIVCELIGTHDQYPALWDDWDLHQLIELARISSDWESAILSTSIFWANISIHSSMEDLQIKVAMGVHLSRDTPLNVFFEPSTPSWECFRSMIVPQGSRLRSIIFDSSTSIYNINFESEWTQFLDLLKQFTSLESLVAPRSYNCELNAGVVSFAEMPSIRNLQGFHIIGTDFHPEGMRRLQSLATDTTLPEIFGGLCKLTSLQTVALRSFYIIGEPYSLPDDAEENLTLLGPLRWTSFTCEHPLKGLDIILSRLSTILVDLSIAPYWDQLCDALTSCSKLQALRRLELALSLDHQAIFQVPIDLQQSNIQDLYIQLGTSEALRLLYTYGYAASADENVTNLTQFLIGWAPAVKNLSISSRRRYPVTFDYIKSLPHLKTLEFCDQSGETWDKTDVELSASGKIIIRGPFSLLSWVYSRTAHELLYQIKDHRDETSSLGLRRWTFLHTLDLRVDAIGWDIITLPHLKKLIVGEGKYNNSVLPSIFEQIALRPTLMPSLNYIGIRGVLEWDILFIMLEGRNFLYDLRISPITTLALTCLPPPHILEPLTERLGCRQSKRSPNFGLSTSAMAPVFFDMNVKGCAACHRSFLFCPSTDAPNYDWTYNPDYPRPTLDVVLPPYPDPLSLDENDEILATRAVREVGWNDALTENAKICGWRGNYCSRHNVDSLTEITEFAPVGTETISGFWLGDNQGPHQS